jgi:hypothetical protein
MTSSARMAMIFSCVGHFYIHMMATFYFVIVLTLVVEWDQPYSELFQLWTIASALVGLVAIPAGGWPTAGMSVEPWSCFSSAWGCLRSSAGWSLRS